MALSFKKKLKKLHGKGKRFLGRHKKRLIMSYANLFESKRTPVVENKIALQTLNGSFSCNPKYLYRKMKEACPDFQFVWIVPEKKLASSYPEDAEVFLLDSKEGRAAAFSAKYWIDNGVLFSEYFEKKPEQIHIQLMHGSLGIKKLDNAIKSRMKQGHHGKVVIRRETENTDYVITNSRFEEDAFRTTFWKNTSMLRFGHARCDILFSPDEALKDSIRETLLDQYGIPKDCRLVLYAPTHRAGVSLNVLDVDYEMLCSALKERFGGKYVVMARFHQRSIHVKMESIPDLVYNVTSYPDIQELMLVTDIGITDYSSWIYDYVLTKRPGFLYATDIDTYVDRTGFFYPLEATPFPVCKNNRELVESIRDFDMDSYQKKAAEFIEDKECVDDGHAAERTTEWFAKSL